MWIVERIGLWKHFCQNTNMPVEKPLVFNNGKEGKMVKRLILSVIPVSLFCLSTGVQAATFNVITPAQFRTALTTAQANGQDDTINVSAGTYNIASTLTYDTTQNFDLTLVGAAASTTILDGGKSVQIMNLTGTGSGDISISGLTLKNGRNGAVGGLGGALFANNSADGAITIDRCIVTNSTSVKNTGGAWIGAENGNLTVTNSSFTHNSCDEGTSDDGCGLYLYFDSETAAGNAIVRNNDISYNTLNHNLSPIGNCDGAGLMIYHLGTSGSGHSFTIENNTINNNLSYEGAGGMSLHLLHQNNTIIIRGNTFSGNTAGPLPEGVPIQIYGGGAHVYCAGGSFIINNNQFLNNKNLDPNGIGGGLSLDALGGTLEMIGNIFAGNQNSGMGGGAFIFLETGITRANIVQNLFVNNQAGPTEGSGGGLSLSTNAGGTNLINNTFYNNSASDGGGMTYYAEAAAHVASLYNEIYRENTPNAISVFAPGPVQATYSNIEGGSGETYFKAGCIDVNPFFFNAANPPGADGVYGTLDDGLHLTVGSPSMNTGSNAAVPATLATDIAGQIRIQAGTVDMGAYEGVDGSSSLVFVSSTGNCGVNLPCFSSIQAAIDATATESGSVIRIAEGTYTESISLNQSKALTLQGGWDSSFATQNRNTVLRTAPAALQGSLTFQMLTITP